MYTIKIKLILTVSQPSILSISADDCCKTFLQNFSLTIEPQSPGSATAYTYTDSKLSAEAVYTVVPPPSSVNFPASQVRIDVTDSSNDTSLNLCEVFVFGGEIILILDSLSFIVLTV